jgi:antitoxin (DNA-binding transcriptional repressor) of toxin-antitoxin stability system
LRRYIERAACGERIAITAHGRIVAELVPAHARKCALSCFERLIAAGVIRPPLERGDPTQGWPRIQLARGTARTLVDADRSEP